jgi:hypothetical protein
MELGLLLFLALGLVLLELLDTCTPKHASATSLCKQDSYYFKHTFFFCSRRNASMGFCDRAIAASLSATW